MAVALNPYLSFKSNAREAMEFYQSVFGGTLDVQTFKDLNASQDPAEENLVMHSQLEGDNGERVVAVFPVENAVFEQIAVVLTGGVGTGGGHGRELVVAELSGAEVVEDGH